MEKIFGEVEETQIITHKVLIPPNVSGKVTWVAEEGDYNIVEAVVKVESESGIKEVAMSHEWPVRVPRPVREFKDANTLLVTGQRVLDVFFPIAKGGYSCHTWKFWHRKDNDTTSNCKVLRCRHHSIHWLW